MIKQKAGEEGRNRPTSSRRCSSRRRRSLARRASDSWRSTSARASRARSTRCDAASSPWSSARFSSLRSSSSTIPATASSALSPSPSPELAHPAGRRTRRRRWLVVVVRGERGRVGIRGRIRSGWRSGRRRLGGECIAPGLRYFSFSFFFLIICIISFSSKTPVLCFFRNMLLFKIQN